MQRKHYTFLIIALFIILTSSIILNHSENDQLILNDDTSIRYDGYYSSFNDAYIYNVITWSFTTNNESEITVYFMDYMNYRKFDLNDSTMVFKLLSEGHKHDYGIIKITHNDRWVLLFYNNDPNHPLTSISIEVEVILDPTFYLIIPLSLNLVIITFFIATAIYFRKKQRENILNGYFCCYILILLMYIYVSLQILPLIKYLQ